MINDLEIIKRQISALLSTMSEICTVLHRIDLSIDEGQRDNDRQKQIPHQIITEEDYE